MPQDAQVSATISAETKEKLDRFTEQLGQVGCVGVVTDAKPAAVAFYQALGFVPLDWAREGTLHGDPLPMFLSIQTIAAAVQVDPLADEGEVLGGSRPDGSTFEATLPSDGPATLTLRLRR